MAYLHTRVVARAVLATGLLASAIGCSSGQTGSPDCGGASSCVCDSVADRIQLRATVEDVSNGAVILTVQEIFTPTLPRDVASGERIGGAATVGLPCVDDDGRSVTPGEDVFVSYVRGDADRYPICTEYQACAAEHCDALVGDPRRWEQCDAFCAFGTEEACNEHRTEALLAGDLWMVPWDDVLALGGEFSLESEDAAILAEEHSCVERFPPPYTPCDDTASSCSTRRLRGDRAQRASYVLAALGVLACWRRRRHELHES